jgi:hypothetical protein
MEGITIGDAQRRAALPLNRNATTLNLWRLLSETPEKCDIL